MPFDQMATAACVPALAMDKLIEAKHLLGALATRFATDPGTCAVLNLVTGCSHQTVLDKGQQSASMIGRLRTDAGSSGTSGALILVTRGNPFFEPRSTSFIKHDGPFNAQSYRLTFRLDKVTTASCLRGLPTDTWTVRSLFATPD